MRTCSWEGVTRESVEEALANFRGEIEQTPPMCVRSVVLFLLPQLALTNRCRTQLLGAQDGWQAPVRVRADQHPPPATNPAAQSHGALARAPPLRRRVRSRVRVAKRGARRRGQEGTRAAREDGQGGPDRGPLRGRGRVCALGRRSCSPFSTSRYAPRPPPVSPCLSLLARANPTARSLFQLARPSSRSA